MDLAALDRIRDQALLLAREGRRAEPAITKILWFPDEKEVRLVELEDTIPRTIGGVVEPFHFPPSPEDKLPDPSAIAIIRSDEIQRLALPDVWGTWDDAEELEAG